MKKYYSFILDVNGHHDVQSHDTKDKAKEYAEMVIDDMRRGLKDFNDETDVCYSLVPYLEETPLSEMDRDITFISGER